MDDNSICEDYNANMMEIKNTLEILKEKNTDLRETINYLKIENLSYKQRYQSLKQNLTNLSRLLEQNVQIYNELFDDTRSALEIARISILASPKVRIESSQPRSVQEARNEKVEEKNVQSTNSNHNQLGNGNVKIVSQQIIVNSSEKKRENATLETTIDTQKKNAKIPSTTKVEIGCTQRKKIPIQPINIQEVVDQIVEADNEQKNQNKTNSSFEDRLTTIAEEETQFGQFSKTLSVRVARLSTNTLNKYLKKENSPTLNNPIMNDSELFTRSNPTFTSTPIAKMEIMKTLGLMPSPKNDIQVRNFITVRKKGSGSRRSSLKLISPKKERISLISPKKENSGSSKENFSPKSNNSNRASRKRKSLSTTPKIKKRRKTNTEKNPEQSSRPSRKARPRDMKEKSIRTKLRRS